MCGLQTRPLVDADPHNIMGPLTDSQGSCAGLEFKASLEKSLNFRKLKMALNCFGKRMEGLVEFVYRESFNKTW